MAAIVAETRAPARAIHEFIIAARDNEKRDRHGVRYPFFRPLSIQVDSGHSFSAFSRDISPLGIGLLHNFELKTGDVEVAIVSDAHEGVRLPMRIVWCQPCGEGWYISGAEFVDRYRWSLVEDGTADVPQRIGQASASSRISNLAADLAIALLVPVAGLVLYSGFWLAAMLSMPVAAGLYGLAVFLRRGAQQEDDE